MEEVLTELNQYAESVPVPLELPTEDDLLTVEESILLPLPREYREFLLQATDLVIGAIEPCTAADSSSHTYLPEVTSECWDRGLERHLIPVCVFGDTTYAINPEGVVAKYDVHFEEQEQWESVWEWAMEVWLKSAL